MPAHEGYKSELYVCGGSLFHFPLYSRKPGSWKTLQNAFIFPGPCYPCNFFYFTPFLFITAKSRRSNVAQVVHSRRNVHSTVMHSGAFALKLVTAFYTLSGTALAIPEHVLFHPSTSAAREQAIVSPPISKHNRSNCNSKRNESNSCANWSRTFYSVV